MDQTTLLMILVVGGGLAAGGVVKGASGIGLPMVAVPIMALAVSVPTAVSLMTFPILASNIVQATQGGRWRPILRRFWPILAIQPFGMSIGAAALAWADPRVLIGTLGGIVVLFVAAIRFQPAWHVSLALERWLAPPVGLLSGLIGGISSFFGMPIAMFLLSLRLEKDDFVAAVGVTYACGALSLILVLTLFGLLGPQLYLLSMLGVPAVLAGVWVGQLLRRRLNAQTFRNFVLFVLLLAGLNMIRRALTG